MREFAIAYHTDMGIRRLSNQDSILIKGMNVGTCEIILAVLCDGMGGMEKGELASATVIRFFARWFQDEYMRSKDVWNIDVIQNQWMSILAECNEKLQNYGRKEAVQLGTTVTVLLLHSSGQYLIAHVGDTRIYKCSNNLQQLTEDHTFIAREIRNGNMTEEQARKDSRRNVLLQCIGVNEYFEPQIVNGYLGRGEAALICSDGFRHEISESEIFHALNPIKMCTEKEMKQMLINLVELNKQRKETDNISAIYIKRL